MRKRKSHPSRKSLPQYKPFQYPPNYELAEYHKSTTLPGIQNLQSPKCPCCDHHQKTPYPNWFSRSVTNDFRQYGGAVIGYFWLMKLYIVCITLIIGVYGVYLQKISFDYCGKETKLQKESCVQIFGIWMVTNQDLYHIMKDAGADQQIVTFFTLRSIMFFIVLSFNAFSLFLMKYIKKSKQEKPLSDFCLVFKNVQQTNSEAVIKKICQQVGTKQQIEIKDVVFIRQVQPYYTAYQSQLELFYELKIEDNPKEKKNLILKLSKLHKTLYKHEHELYNLSSRAIVVFNSVIDRDAAYKHFRVNKLNKVKMFLNNSYEKQSKMFCSSCPKPKEIVWHNFGKIQKQAAKVKILSVVYFFLIIIFCVVFLHYGLKLIYKMQFASPWYQITAQLILLVVVILAVTFRQLMNRLSEMRYPNTYTARSMFIVITTVVFHFVIYLLIPVLYLRFNPEIRGKVLFMFTNQGFTFILTHVIFAAIDLIYCLWNSQRKKVENQEKPIGCQKILHQKIQYNRFPIQFKLIVLFKLWSLVTFFCFHVPFLMILLLFTIIFLYVKDKFNLYYHYRMEYLSNDVEFNFLKIYANFFTLFAYFTYVFTQSYQFQKYFAASITIIFLIIQIFGSWFKNEKKKTDRAQSVIALNYEQLQLQNQYREQYQKFIDIARSDKVDEQIHQFLNSEGFGSIRTQQSLKENLVQEHEQ